jgi:putative pyruvate formate lyase activating enzyme
MNTHEKDTFPTASRINEAYKRANPCQICPRNCRVNRLAGERGYCKVGDTPIVSSAGPHFGEEPPLVGRGGSGTIFLGGCNLGCVFCQNYTISHNVEGEPTAPAQLARIMLLLQRRGCENINFVTPTHVTPWLMEATRLARLDGLRVPIVYNCGGYESVETLRLLEGTVDIYMPDAKYWDEACARRYSNAPDYPAIMREALKEMHRQVGELEIVGGVARRGLLVRHLVMPGGVAGSKDVLKFIADEISPRTFVNVMDQYRPVYRAHEFHEIARRPTAAEYEEARAYAEKLGLRLC